MSHFKTQIHLFHKDCFFCTGLMKSNLPTLLGSSRVLLMFIVNPDSLKHRFEVAEWAGRARIIFSARANIEYLCSLVFQKLSKSSTLLTVNSTGSTRYLSRSDLTGPTFLELE